MDTPEIKIKGLKTAEFQSKDSLCFSCSVYVNGKKAFTASDDGWGEEICFRPIFDNELFELAKEYAKSLPPEHAFGVDLPMDLEFLIGNMVEDMNLEKKLKTLCKKRVVFRLPGDEPGEYRSYTRPYTEFEKKWVLNQYPGAEIINERFLGV